jgi:hypothetical protein
MPHHTNHALRFAALTIGAVLLGVPVAAATPVPMDFTALATSSDAVVVARVLGSSARLTGPMDAKRPLVVTDTRLEVTSVAEGSRPRVVTVTQLGGVVGDVGVAVDDLPTFFPGEQCVVFLDRQNHVVGGDQGKLDVARGRLSGYGASVGTLGAMVREAHKGAHFRPVAPVTSSAGLVAVPPASTGSPAASAPAAPAGASAVPSIWSISPPKAIAGMESVVILGSGFGGSPGRVTFVSGLDASGATRVSAAIASWSDGRIECAVPANACSGGVTVTNSSGTSGPSSTYETSFSADGMFWNDSVARYRINENAPTMTGEGDQIRLAFVSWSAVTPKFAFGYDATPTHASSYPPRSNDVNEIYFATNMPTNDSLAQNIRWFDPATNEVLESDIALNGNLAWGATSVKPDRYGRGAVYDVQTVVLHELGHTVGLLDQYPNTWRVMGAYTGDDRRALTADEIAGVNYLYAQTSRTSWSGASVTANGASSQSIGYGQATEIGATLRDDQGVAFSDPAVSLQFSEDGRTYAELPASAMTNPQTGVYRATVAPVRRGYYRFWFNGSGTKRRSFSSVAVITPAVRLTSPSAKSRVKARKSFTVSGSLYPRHTPGARSVLLKVTRAKGRRWVNAGMFWAKNYDGGSYTRYSTTLKLKAGTYRIYASAPADGDHNGSPWTGYRKVVVK